MISAAIAAYLVWRELFAGEVGVLQTIFWALFHDLVAFVPIGLFVQKT